MIKRIIGQPIIDPNGRNCENIDMLFDCRNTSTVIQEQLSIGCNSKKCPVFPSL